MDLAAVDRILEEHDHDPHAMLSILEAIQAAFGHLPVAALKRISHRTGAWYAMIYGTAQLLPPPALRAAVEEVAVCRCTACLMAGGGRVAEAIGAGLGTELGRPTPDGRIRFTWCPTHVAGAAAPLVTLDGEPQPEVAAANATAWAQALAGEHPATRTVH